MIEFREFLLDLSLRMATWGCTALFLCEYTEFVADNLILLRFVEYEMEVKRYLRVVKMRSSSHDTMLWEVCIDEKGLSFAYT